MKPIGILMREHRLIEKMIELLREELEKMNNHGDIDVGFIDVDIDFFRIYVDRTHHGKEEEILFKQMAVKPISPGHREMIGILIEEHERARVVINRLSQSKESYSRGNREALKDVKDCIRELIVLYPSHIAKEDKHFFFPIMDYFTGEEQMEMVQEFRDFDMQMIHENYRGKIQQLKESLEVQKI